MADRRIDQLCNIVAACVDNSLDELPIYDNGAATTKAITPVELSKVMNKQSVVQNKTLNLAATLRSFDAENPWTKQLNPKTPQAGIAWP